MQPLGSIKSQSLHNQYAPSLWRSAVAGCVQMREGNRGPAQRLKRGKEAMGEGAGPCPSWSEEPGRPQRCARAQGPMQSM